MLEKSVKTNWWKNNEDSASILSVSKGYDHKSLKISADATYHFKENVIKFLEKNQFFSYLTNKNIFYFLLKIISKC